MEKKKMNLQELLEAFPEEIPFNEAAEIIKDFPEEERRKAFEEIRKKQHGFWDDPEQVHYYSEVHHRVPLTGQHFRELARAVDPKPGETIIDLGCGVGTFLKFLLTENKTQQLKIVGIDYSDRALKKAKERLAGLTQGIDIKYISQDLKSPLPFEDNSVDKAISNWAIVYLSRNELKNSLREVKRVLKEGGKFFFSALIRGGARKHLSPENLGFLISSVLQEPGATFKALRFEKKCRSYFPEYSLEELKGMMKEAGFEILETKYTVVGKTATIIQKA